MGIFTPGINLLCFNLLSSTIKSISFEIPKKLFDKWKKIGDEACKKAKKNYIRDQKI